MCLALLTERFNTSMQERDTHDSENTEMKFQCCNTVVMNRAALFLCERNGSDVSAQKQKSPTQPSHVSGYFCFVQTEVLNTPQRGGLTQWNIKQEIIQIPLHTSTLYLKFACLRTDKTCTNTIPNLCQVLFFNIHIKQYISSGNLNLCGRTFFTSILSWAMIVINEYWSKQSQGTSNSLKEKKVKMTFRQQWCEKLIFFLPSPQIQAV